MINPMNRATPVRLMGMASGMDTDFIIQNAMRAHQFRIDQRVRQRTLIEWRQQTHNSIGDQLRDFQRTMLSMTSPRSMFASNNFNTHVANLTGSNNNAFSITTRASSTVGNFSVLGVNSLARGAGITSGSRISASNAGIPLTTRLGDLELSGDNKLRFQNDRMTINFGGTGAAGTANAANNVTFTREWVHTDRLQGSNTTYNDFRFTYDLNDGNGPQTLSFDMNNPYLPRGVAQVTVGDETFHVTRSATGNLQRVEMDRVTPVQFANANSRPTFVLGSGDNQQTVRVSRSHNNATGFSYSFEIRTGTGAWQRADRLLGFEDRDAFVDAVNAHFADHEPEVRDAIRDIMAEHIDDDGFLNQRTFSEAIGELNLDLEDLSAIGDLITEHGSDYFTLSGLNEGNSFRFNETRNANGAVTGLTRIADTAFVAPQITHGEAAEPIVITVGGEDVRITGIHRNMTISDMISRINSQLNGRATISYDQITDRFTIESSQIGSDSSISVSGLDALGLGSNGTATVGSTASVTVMLESGEILTLQGDNNGMRNTVNFGGVTINLNRTFGTTAANVQAFRESNTHTTSTTVFDEQGFLDAIRARFYDPSADGNAALMDRIEELITHWSPDDELNRNGLINALVGEFDGDGELALEADLLGYVAENTTTTYTTEFDQVGFNADLNAHFVANTDRYIETAANVEIARNVDQVVENITDFINAYNSIISRIEGLLRERKTPAERSYLPLTDEEKQHMTEAQIEQWEEIARRGIMRGDHALENLARELRSSFFESIEGLGMRPSDIGLSTGNFFDGTGGQIFINEERLRAALQEDPDRVMAIFTQRGETRAEQGLVTRINETINGFIGISGAGGTQRNTLRGLERSIRNVNDQIERMTIRMFAEEDRLFRQFAAMERAMSQLQSQGDWFNAMLGSMN